MRYLLFGILKGLDYADVVRWVSGNYDDVWVVEYQDKRYEIQVYPQ